MNVPNIPRPLVDIANLFGNDQLRGVGGCVRDSLLGFTPKDWDCCTPATPEETTRILKDGGYAPYDLSNGHGTISVNVDGEIFEITTLREDVKTDGRRAKVAFIRDYVTDAARRDFTINAMSCDLVTGEVYDYFNGLRDLNSTSKIKFVGNAFDRIEEDYLRILRYFRFLARFDTKPDIETLAAIHLTKDGLNKISGERIWSEMQQIFNYNDPNTLTAMRGSGVMDVIINR